MGDPRRALQEITAASVGTWSALHLPPVSSFPGPFSSILSTWLYLFAWNLRMDLRANPCYGGRVSQARDKDKLTTGCFLIPLGVGCGLVVKGLLVPKRL